METESVTSEVSEVEVVEVDPTVGGEIEDIDTPGEQPNILSLDEYNDYVVDLNGELVPVSELKGGGLRQQDYTRKTQEVAELRREAERAITLERALQANPTGTLQYLAEQYGLTVGQVQQQLNQNDDWFEDEQQANPLEQRLAAMEQVFQQQQAEREVSATFDRLKAKYGDGFDPQEVARAAMARNIFDPNLLEMVYRDLAYEKLTVAQQQAQASAQSSAQAEAARRAAAAQQAAQAASSADASGANAPEPTKPSRPLTIREAAELAYAQLERGE